MSLCATRRMRKEVVCVADGSVVIDIQGDASELLGELRRVTAGAGNTASSMSNIFKGTFLADAAMKGVTMLADGLKTASQYVIEVGSGFEASMSQVAATMGLTAEEIAAGSEAYNTLAEAAKEAGSTTAYSASQAAEALNYLALAGYDAATAADALPAVLDLAAAGGMELGEAADLATDAMAALGIEASNANLTAFGDQMAVTASKANTSVSQLGQAILTVGGTAKSLAGGTVELNAALGVLANRGIKSAEGGTALRNIILSLTAPTDKAASTLKKLGVSVLDAGGDMRSLNDIFQDLDHSLAGLSEGEKTAVLNDIFNKVDLKSAQAMLAGAGAEFDNLAGAIEASAGAMGEMADVQLDNLAGDITVMRSALEGVGITLYEKLQGPLRNAVQGFTEFIGIIPDIVDNAIALAPAITGVTAAILGMVAAQKAAAAMTALAGAVKAVTLALSANPFILVTGAVVGLAAALGTSVLQHKASAEAMTEEVSAAKALAESTASAAEAARESADARQAMTQASVDAYTATENQVEIAQRYIRELDGMTDANGRVKAGQEEAARYMADYINTILPGAVRGYEDEAGAVYEVNAALNTLIATKKKEAALSAYQDDYENALSSRLDLMKQYSQAQQDLAAAEENLARAQMAVETNTTPGSLAAVNAALAEAEAAYENAKAAVVDYGNQLNTVNGTITGYEMLLSMSVDDMSRWGEAMALLSGDVVASISGSSDAIAENCARMEEQFSGLQGAMQVAGDLMGQSWAGASEEMRSTLIGGLETVRSQMESQLSEMRKQGAKIPPEFANGINEGSYHFTGAMKSLYEGALKELHSTDGPMKAGENFDILLALGIIDAEGNVVEAAEKVTAAAEAALQEGASSGAAEQAGAAEGEQYAAGLQRSAPEATSAAEEVAESADDALLAGSKSSAPEEAGEEKVVRMVAGMESKLVAARASAEAISQKTAEGLKAGISNAGLDKTGSDMTEAVASGAASGAGKVSTELTGAVSGAIDTAQGAARGATKIGQYVAAGIADGIAAGSGRITAAATAAVNRALSAAQAAAGIHSPSTVFRDEVGRYLAEGVGVGITQNAYTAAEAAGQLIEGTLYEAVRAADKAEESFQGLGERFMGGIAAGIQSSSASTVAAVQATISAMEEETDKAIAAIDAAQAGRAEERELRDYERKKADLQDKYDTAAAKDREKARQDLEDYEADWNEKQLQKQENAAKERLKAEQAANKERLNEEIKAAEERRKVQEEASAAYEKTLQDGLEKVRDTYADAFDAIEQEYQDSYSKLAQAQSDFAGRLGEFDLFERNERTGKLTLTNIKAQTAAIEEYGRALTALQERGIDGNLFQEILDLDMADASDLASTLLSMGDKAWDEYMEAFAAKGAAAQEVAAAVYGPELAAAESLYEAEKAALESQYMEEMPQNLANVAQDAMDALEATIRDKGQDAVDAAAAIAQEIAAQFRDLGLGTEITTGLKTSAQRTSEALASKSLERHDKEKAAEREETGRAMLAATAAGGVQAADREIVLQLDGVEMARALLPYNRAANDQSPMIVSDK